MIEGAIEKGIPVITEVELAYQISEAPFIGLQEQMEKQQRQH